MYSAYLYKLPQIVHTRHPNTHTQQEQQKHTHNSARQTLRFRVGVAGSRFAPLSKTWPKRDVSVGLYAISRGCSSNNNKYSCQSRAVFRDRSNNELSIGIFVLVRIGRSPNLIGRFPNQFGCFLNEIGLLHVCGHYKCLI